MNRPHPTYHVFYPGSDPVKAATRLIEINPDLAVTTLATCIWHYKWVLKPALVPDALEEHPEVALWRRSYVALAGYGAALAALISANPVLRELIDRDEREYFGKALASLDAVQPLRERPEHERAPRILQVPERIQIDELAARVLNKRPDSPVLALLPLYPLENIE